MSVPTSISSIYVNLFKNDFFIRSCGDLGEERFLVVMKNGYASVSIILCAYNYSFLLPKKPLTP